MAENEIKSINGRNVCDQTARDNIPTKTSQLTNDSNFVTDSIVDEKISNAQLGGGEVDLSSYAKKTDLPTKTSQLTNDSGYITNIPDEYITETELTAKGYATTSQIPTVPTNVSAFTNDAKYASETFVSNKIAEAQLGGGSESGGTSIDDTTTSTNKTWSSSKIDSQIKDIANNPVIIDILKRLSILEIPSPLPEPTMKLIKKYSSYYIRTKWDDSYDMLEQISPANGSNGQFNFISSSLINTDTADNSVDSTTKITVKNSADDACPLCINNGYIGGNHGFDFNIKATVTAHDKVEADIGSIWKDENNINFTLVTIKDANTLYFMSDDKSADGTWEFTKTIGSTLTHVSGATNTGSITITASANANLLPSVNNYAYTMKTKDGDLNLTSSFQTAEATYLEITETFDIMDANEIITYLRANVGNNTNDSFHDNSIGGVIRVTNKYHFRPNSSCTIYTKYDIKKKIALSKNPILRGYIGFTQTQQMPKPTGGQWNLYIPDINPINNVEYDTSIAQVNNFPMTYIGNCKNNKVASRATQYYTSNDGTICNKYGITTGYNTNLYLGRHEVRKNNVDRIFNGESKMYISGVSVNSTNYDSGVNAGEVLEMVSFRINENYSTNPDFTSCNYYYVGDDIYYNVAIHKNFEGKIPVIGAMYGMEISIVEDNGNVTITDTYVKKSGIGIEVTNNYGYAILKLTKSNV